MTEHIPQYLLIPLKHEKTTERRLRLMAKATRERGRWLGTSSFTLPCTQCAGKGCYTKARDGSRRPFDHRDFQSGERFIATCPKCCGGGHRECTVEELRREYRLVRKLVCLERGFEPEGFDAMVKRHIVAKDPSPGTWYEAAKEIASTFGIAIHRPVKKKVLAKNAK